MTPGADQRRGPLAHRVALVTGAGRSIGRSVAISLARGGADVAIHYRSRPSEAQELANELVELFGVRSVALPADLSVAGQVEQLFESVEQALGGIDIVVANAGSTAPMGPVADLSDDAFSDLISSNVWGTFHTLRGAARRVRDGGRIVTISSSSVRFAPAGFGAYASSKASGLVLTEVLAKELGHRGVTSNAVMAGPTASGFLDPASPAVQAAPPDTLESLAKAAPMGRLAEPEDIASVVTFLASQSSGWVNGQVILVNNGGSV